MNWLSVPIWCLLVVAQALAWDPPSACAKEPGLPLGPAAQAVLDKYPSPADVAEEIRQLQAAEPGVVEEVLADFDLAIRSSLTLKPPAAEAQQRFHVLPQERITAGSTRSRASLENLIQCLRNEPHRFVLSDTEVRSYIEFYEKHFDELVVEDHPQLGLIMMHVLAFGWEDWSAWDPQDERLARAREQFPELHRMNAPVDDRATGILLRIAIADGDDALGRRCFRSLESIGNEDVLRFYVDCAIRSPNMLRHGRSLWSEIYTISQRMLSQTGGKDRARAFWEPYLDSDVPTLWYCAQQAFDRAVPEDPGWVTTAQADWNFEHEPDPAVRARLARRREIARQMAEINARKDPETNRLSMEDVAALQALRAELKQLDDQERQSPPNK
jgi:hypothetical protein